MGNPSFSYNNVKCFCLKELFGLFVANKSVSLGCSQFKLRVILEFYKDSQSVLNIVGRICEKDVHFRQKA